MTEPPVSTPAPKAADVVPRYAFQRAIDIINVLMDAYKDLATTFAEARPDAAAEIAAHLAVVFDSVRTAVGEALAPPPGRKP